MSRTETERTPKRIVKVPRREKAPEPAIDVTPIKSATCGLCGESYSSDDWRQIAPWLSAHLAQKHPQDLKVLMSTAKAFATWLISQCYETEPDWNLEEAMMVLRKELLEILQGKRDPLTDGMS